MNAEKRPGEPIPFGTVAANAIRSLDEVDGKGPAAAAIAANALLLAFVRVAGYVDVADAYVRCIKRARRK